MFPQVKKQSEEKMTRVQELLLKFDNNPKAVKIEKTQAQVKPKPVETVTDVMNMNSYCNIKFGRQMTSTSCGVYLSNVTNSLVQKQADVQEEDVQEVQVVQKHEETDVLEQITAAQTITFASKENSPSNLKRLLSQ